MREVHHVESPHQFQVDIAAKLVVDLTEAHAVHVKGKHHRKSPGDARHASCAWLCILHAPCHRIGLFIVKRAVLHACRSPERQWEW